MTLVRRYLDNVETRSVSYADVWGKGGDVLSLGMGSPRTSTGRRMTRNTAMKYSTAYACISLKADSWGQLPIVHYTEDADGTRKPVPPAGRAPFLNDPSGEGDTGFNLGEAISMSLDTAGNYYAEVIANPATGQVLAIPTLDPHRVEVTRDETGAKCFDVMVDSGDRVRAYPYRRGMAGGVLHIPSIRMPGALVGLSPLDLASEGIGLGLTAEEYGAMFFQNGARPDLVIELPEGTKATDPLLDRLRKGWQDRHQGAAKAHRPGILSDGAKLKNISLQHDHAQFLQTRGFQREDVASWFRTPPHMVGIVSKVTSYGAGLAEQSTGFARYTMAPPISRSEQAIVRSLMPEGEGITWDMAGLERSTTSDRYGTYSIGRQAEFLSINDIRRMEGLPPIPDGDEYVNPNVLAGASEDGRNGNPTPPSGAGNNQEPEEGDE